MSSDNAQKRIEPPYLDKSRDNDQKRCVYKYRNAAKNHSLISFHKNKSLLSATTFLSRSPMAYNTTPSLDKLTCTEYVDFGKCQDRFGQNSWSQNDSNYLDVKPKVIRKVDKKEF